MEASLSDYHNPLYPNYQPTHTPPAPAPVPDPFDAEQAAQNCTDPLFSGASSLMRLEAPSQKFDASGVQEALKSQAQQISQNDLSGIETMLSVQTQMLHTLFAQAIEKYATARGFDSFKHYGNIALKAQSYCRMTVAAISKVKNAGHTPGTHNKNEEPAIKEPVK